MSAAIRQLDRRWRALLVIAGVYVVVLVGVAGYRARAPYDKEIGTSDCAGFYVSARRFLDTGQIVCVRNYLPACTLLMIPLAVLPCWLGAALMAAGSIPALLFSLWLIYRHLAPPDGTPTATRYAVPILMLVPYIHACLVLGQLSIYIGLLCLLTWWMIRTRRQWLAGFPLSVALLIKPFLMPLVLFLLIKRQWRAVALTVALVGLIGVAGTLAAVGPAAWVETHRAYYHNVVRRYTPLAAIGSERSRIARYNNQSLPIVLRRLLTDTPAGKRHRQFRVNLAVCSPRVPQGIYMILMSIIAGVTVLLGRRALDRISSDRAGFEFAMFLLWSLFSSPVVWTHYYPLVLYPLVLLTVQRVRDGEAGRPNRLGRVAWWFWIAAAASLVTEVVTLPYLRAIGIHLWATVLIWAAMAAYAWRVPPTRPQ